MLYLIVSPSRDPQILNRLELALKKNLATAIDPPFFVREGVWLVGSELNAPRLVVEKLRSHVPPNMLFAVINAEDQNGVMPTPYTSFVKLGWGDELIDVPPALAPVEFEKASPVAAAQAVLAAIPGLKVIGQDPLERLEELRHLLDETFVGLEAEKAEILKIFSGISFREVSALWGANLKVGPKNMLFSGPPGVGKTTLARAIAPFFAGTPQGKVVSIKACDLGTGYIMQTDEKMRAALERAAGGVLVIDQLDYLLGSEFGRSALQVLNDHMSDKPNDPVILATAQQTTVNGLWQSTTGLQSRFPHQLVFSSFSDALLNKIFDRKVEQAGLIAAPGLSNAVQMLLSKKRARDRDLFGNARDVGTLFDAMVDNMGQRLQGVALTAVKAETLGPGITQTVRDYLKTLLPSDLPAKDKDLHKSSAVLVKRGAPAPISASPQIPGGRKGVVLPFGKPQERGGPGEEG